ncbi:hypothetical protein MRX96_011493 [Rhipicephalus microplus]
MDGNGRKVLFYQQLGERHATLNCFHKDDHLVELKEVEQLKQFAVLFVVLQFHVVLLETSSTTTSNMACNPEAIHRGIRAAKSEEDGFVTGQRRAS